MISQGASEINLTFVIDEADVPEAVRRLHAQVLRRSRSRGVRLSARSTLWCWAAARPDRWWPKLRASAVTRSKSSTRDENTDAAWLTPSNLRDIDVVIDFTTPDAVLANIEACMRARKADGGRNHRLVRRDGAGARAVEAGGHRVRFRRKLFLRREPVLPDHAKPPLRPLHTDTPATSPSAITSTRKTRRREPPQPCNEFWNRRTGVHVDITSEREGDVTGTHTLELDSAGDRIVLTHEAKSRRTFAEGAVLAAEWIAGKTGFYDFKDIFSQL